MVALQVCCLVIELMAATVKLPAGISISRLEAQDLQILRSTLISARQNRLPSKLLMKGVHDHHISDARPKQTEIHILAPKFSLDQAAGSCSGFYGLWYL